MDVLNIFPLLFGLSSIYIAYILFRYFQLREDSRQLEKTLSVLNAEIIQIKKKQKESYEVLDLLHDLSNGRGLIEVKRVAPSSFFLRSPRDQ